jgi:hypothetical protein
MKELLAQVEGLRVFALNGSSPENPGRLNGSSQHSLEVFSQEYQNPKFLEGVNWTLHAPKGPKIGSVKLQIPVQVSHWS